MNYIGFGKYLDAGRFGVLPMNGRDFHIKSKGLIWLTTHSEFIIRERSLGPLRRLEFKNATDLPLAYNPEELVYAQGAG